MPIQTLNPATGEKLESFTALTEEQLEAKLARAHKAFLDWRDQPLRERVKLLRKVAEILQRDRRTYAELMTQEMGKLVGAAEAEALKCAACCTWYADNADRLLKPEVIEIENEDASVHFQPLGVVLAVMPWNFPFWQVLRFAAPAILAGNAALLKHASNVPRCALALEKLFIAAGAPEGLFTTLLVGSDAVPALLADPRVAAATVTGSEAAGSSVAEHAGRNLKPTVLELGGSDPFIVLPSANIDAAVKAAVAARTVNNGQSCIAAKRFIVHEDVYAEFEQKFVQQMQALIVGDPMDARTQVGPLATKAGLEELDAQVLASVKAGAKLRIGGKKLKRPGFYYTPTVLAEIPPNSPAARDEIFGPVAAVFKARDIGDAIRKANDSRYGLGASAWTTERREIGRLVEELQAGSVFINAMVASDPRAPFGGIKASGYGRELSAYGLREFVNVKTVRIAKAVAPVEPSTE